MSFEVVDTYPYFRRVWERYGGCGVDVFLEKWIEEYMSLFPELFRLVKGCYGDGWREVARSRVFPRLDGLISSIESAYSNLFSVIPEAYGRSMEFWSVDVEVVFVVYVGVGCGAGWATDYCDRYAVLLGLENIAELGWCGVDDLMGLVLHELSHVVHAYLRGISCKKLEELEGDPLFLLYSEGFATRCEHLILGRESWRIASDGSWIRWCRGNIGFLAREYLRRVDEGRPVNDFYGSWLNIEGRSQTGYFLGHEFIRYLEKGRSIREIAVMDFDEVVTYARRFLLEVAFKNMGRKI